MYKFNFVNLGIHFVCSDPQLVLRIQSPAFNSKSCAPCDDTSVHCSGLTVGAIDSHHYLVPSVWDSSQVHS